MVDRLYKKEENLAAILSPRPSGVQEHASQETPKVTELSHTMSNLSIKRISGAGVTGLLGDLLKTLPEDLVFERETEREYAPLQSLPDEILVLILCMLDPTTIERFAAVSHKARVISLDSAIWRYVTLSRS
jgi:F-box protein 9